MYLFCWIKEHSAIPILGNRHCIQDHSDAILFFKRSADDWPEGLVFTLLGKLDGELLLFHFKKVGITPVRSDFREQPLLTALDGETEIDEYHFRKEYRRFPDQACQLLYQTQQALPCGSQILQ